MKKLFVILFVIAICGTLIAQEKPIAEMYRCTLVGFSEPNTKTNVWSKFEFTEVNYIIHNDIVNGVFTINGKEAMYIHLAGFVSMTPKVDPDGDKYNLIIYDAYDQKGIKCRFIKFDYPEYSNINFVIEYSNLRIYFECNLI